MEDYSIQYLYLQLNDYIQDYKKYMYTKDVNTAP